MNEAVYFDENVSPGFLEVVFIVRESGTKLVRNFDSEYLARKFVEKVKRSKKLILVSYPLFH